MTLSLDEDADSVETPMVQPGMKKKQSRRVGKEAKTRIRHGLVAAELRKTSQYAFARVISEAHSARHRQETNSLEGLC